MGTAFSRPSTWIYSEETCYEVGHTWSPSCVYSTAELFCFVYWEGLRIYLPLYLLSDLISRRPLRDVVRSTIPNALRSGLFLAVNAAGFIMFICITRRLIGRFYHYTAGFLPGFLASILAILCERKGRRGMLTGYVGVVSVETIYRMLKYRGYVHPLPYGEVILFSWAIAVLLSCYRSKPGLQDSVGGMLGILFKPLLIRKWAGQSSGGLLRPVAVWLVASALVCLWSFSLGYVVQCIVSSFQLGRRLVRDPRRIRQVLSKRYNVKFGAFLASLSGVFLVLNMVLRLLGAPRELRISMAGLFAGLSMLFIRSSAISLYIAEKAVEVLFFRAVKAGWLRSCYYGDIVLYSLFTATIFHAALLEGHNLRRSYLTFLNQITRGRVSDVNYDAIDIFGTDASQNTRMMRAQRRVEESMRQRGHAAVPEAHP